MVPNSFNIFLIPILLLHTTTGLNIQFLHYTINLINLPHLTPIINNHSGSLNLTLLSGSLSLCQPISFYRQPTICKKNGAKGNKLLHNSANQSRFRTQLPQSTHIFYMKLRSSLSTESFLVFFVLYCYENNSLLYFYCNWVKN